MAKLSNKLYPNPENAKSHEKGSEVILVQGVRVGDKKFMVPATWYPYNFYINMAIKAETQASKLLEKILKFVRTNKQDVPYVEKELHNDFMQFALNSVVWSYAAIEAKANCLIDDLAPEKKRDRYLKQDLSTKLKDSIPKITKKEKLSASLWDKFHNMDTIRHKIIHTKKTPYWYEADNWNETLDHKMCNGEFKGSSKTALSIIEHFTMESKHTGPTTFHNVQRGLQSRPLKK